MKKQNSLQLFNKGISTPIGILIIVICALLLGGILAWQWSGLQKIKAPEIKAPKEILPPAPSGEVGEEETEQIGEQEKEIDTSDWKTYRNVRCGFELQHPPYLSPDIIDYSDQEELKRRDILYDPATNPVCAGSLKPARPLIFYLSINRTDFKDIDTWFSDYREGLETLSGEDVEGMAGGIPRIVSSEDIVISRYKGKKLEIESDYNWVAIYVLKDALLYRFNYTKAGELSLDEKRLGNQILFTFKFIE